MPSPMHADRRNVLAWSAGGALILGLSGRATAQTTAQAGQGGRSPIPGIDPIDPTEQSKTPMKHAFVDNVVMLAELTVKPERLEEFLEYTVANLALSRSAPGNLAFDILFNEAQPSTVIFYEVWRSAKDQKAYMAWRIKAGDLTRLLSFLASEPKFTALHSIAA